MPNSVLALDVGTHSVRAALVDPQSSEIRHLVEIPIALNRLDDLRVEQDAEAIILSLESAINQVLAHTPVLPGYAALACQRSTVVAWDKATLKPLGPALSWQDTRGIEWINGNRSLADDIHSASGLVLSAHYGASKLRWLEHHYKLTSAQHSMGPLVSFLLSRLLIGKPFVCDQSNAGRTQLMDYRTGEWSDRLLNMFGVNRALLPHITPIRNAFGKLALAPIELMAVSGDQNAALMAMVEQGDSKTISANVGSGAFILRQCEVNTPAHKALLHSIAHSDAASTTYLIEGTVNGAGLSLSHYCQNEPIRSLGGELFLFQHLETWMQQRDKCIPLYMNTLGGLGSPYWRAGPKDGWLEPFGGSSLEEKSVAIIESIVFLLCKNIDLIQLHQPAEKIVLAGGLSRLNGLCQKLADLSQLPVLRLNNTEATLLGSVRMAQGFCYPLQAHINRQFVPVNNPELSQRYQSFHHYLNSH